MTPAAQDRGAHKPGRDERGNYWLDCGCMVNGVYQQRCALHAATPVLLAACEAVLAYCEFMERHGATDLGVESRPPLVSLRAAIAQAKGEQP